MTQSATVVFNFTIGGIQFSSTETRTAEGAISQKITLPAGKSGLMDSTTGVDGLTTGHGLVATDIIDLHYDDPSTGEHKVRRGLVIDTDAANAITFDETPAGIGDALPANDVAVVVSVQVVVNMDVTANELEILAVKSTVKSIVDFWDAAGSELAVLFVGGDSWFWLKDFSSYANPLAGDIVDEVNVSNASTTAGSVDIALLYQSVP